MLIPSGVPLERSFGARVERGKVWAALGKKPGRLRDVPAPRETEPSCEGPAVWISLGDV